MKNTNKISFLLALVFLACFVLWTFLLGHIDVAPIGPCGSEVGFSTINGFIHKTLGVNMKLYTLTDWLGLLPIGVALGFAVLGFVQLLQRKSLLGVDRCILTLGGFYAVIIGVYIIFELIIVNYRPVLIDGRLEASYPSSTTVLVLCVMSTAVMQLKSRIKDRKLKVCVCVSIILFSAFMVICRLISGVHWLSDIIGGILLSAGLVTAYYGIAYE